MRIRLEALQNVVVVHAGHGQALARDPAELHSQLVAACGGDSVPESLRAGIAVDLTAIAGGLLVVVGGERVALPDGDADAAALLWRLVVERRSLSDVVSSIANSSGSDSDLVECSIGPVQMTATRGQVRAGRSLVSRLFGGLRAVSFSASEQARLDELTRKASK